MALATPSDALTRSGIAPGAELLETQATDVLFDPDRLENVFDAKVPFSLGGNDCLVKDSFSKLRPEGRWSDEIDSVAQELAELPLQADELKESDRPAELNKKIDVAILSSFIACERAKERQTGNAEGPPQ